MNLRGAERSTGQNCAVAVLSVLIVAALTLTTGYSQDDAKVRSGLMVWKNSGCADCHGPFADGEPPDDDYPAGANLRSTKLDAAALGVTIRCGRAGTAMPSFDADAYTLRPCPGRLQGPKPDNLQPTPRTLSSDEIESVVAYLQARIIGRGRITLQECLLYYEGQEDWCDDYK